MRILLDQARWEESYSLGLSLSLKNQDFGIFFIFFSIIIEWGEGKEEEEV